MADEYVVVLSTFPTGGEPGRMAGALIGERLAACVNILPGMTSIYRWNDGIEESSEHQVAIKTTRARVPALLERLKGLHPYDVPEFIVLPIVGGSDAYLKWIAESVREP